jgi:hypothetical protein
MIESCGHHCHFSMRTMSRGLLLLVLLTSCQGYGGGNSKSDSEVVTGMTATLTWVAPTIILTGLRCATLQAIRYIMANHHIITL